MSTRTLNPRTVARSALTRRLRAGLLETCTPLAPTGSAKGKNPAVLSASTAAQGKGKASFAGAFTASGKGAGKTMAH